MSFFAQKLQLYQKCERIRIEVRVQNSCVPIKKGKKNILLVKICLYALYNYHGGRGGSKLFVTILMILILALKYFMMVFSPKIHPDPPNIR